MTEQDQYSKHGGFPQFTPAAVAPDYPRLLESLRTLQDLAVSTALTPEAAKDAADRVDDLVELLQPFQVGEGAQDAGRAIELPGRGSLLNPPWRVNKFDAESVRSSGMFRRYHLGGNGAAHGGTLPLLFDDLCGLVVHANGRPISRTAYLHVNYRNVTPLNEKLYVEGRVDRVEGRKTFITGRLTTTDGVLLADCEALMVQLLVGQP